MLGKIYKITLHSSFPRNKQHIKIKGKTLPRRVCRYRPSEGRFKALLQMPTMQGQTPRKNPAKKYALIEQTFHILSFNSAKDSKRIYTIKWHFLKTQNNKNLSLKVKQNLQLVHMRAVFRLAFGEG